jgi:hypothetical protein
VNNVTKDGFQVFYWRAASTTGVGIHWEARLSRNSGG